MSCYPCHDRGDSKRHYPNEDRFKIQKKKQLSLRTRYRLQIPADYSYLGIANFFEPGIRKRANSSNVRKEPRTDRNTGLYRTTIVWLDHNNLKSLDLLTYFMEARIQAPLDIEWLDLSFNEISRIDSDLLHLENLQILYLHCNCLESLDELSRLSSLKGLKILTMYGNPMEAAVDYRLKVVAQLPALRRLDFSPVTQKERSLAKTYIILKTVEVIPQDEKKDELPKEKTDESEEEEEAERKEDVEDESQEEKEESISSLEKEKSLEYHEEEEAQLEKKISAKKRSTKLESGYDVLEEEEFWRKPEGTSWWTRKEDAKTEKMFWELKDLEKKYVFNYFRS